MLSGHTTAETLERLRPILRDALAIQCAVSEGTFGQQIDVSSAAALAFRRDLQAGAASTA